MCIRDRDGDVAVVGGRVSGGESAGGGAVVDHGAGAACAVGAGSPGVEVGEGDLGKSRGLLREGVPVSSRYEFIDAERATRNVDGSLRYTVRLMCVWLAVSVSG